MDDATTTNETKTNEDMRSSPPNNVYPSHGDKPIETHEDNKHPIVLKENRTALANGLAAAVNTESSHYGPETNHFFADNDTNSQAFVGQSNGHQPDTKDTVGQAHGKHLTGNNPVELDQNTGVQACSTKVSDHDVNVKMVEPFPAYVMESVEPLPPPVQNISLFSVPEDNEGSEVFNACGFTDSFSKSNFLRKVYGIVLLQLAVVAGIVYAEYHSEMLRLFTTLFEKTLLIVSAVIYVVAAILTHFGEEWRHRVPYNFMLLLMFTMSVSMAIGVGCANWDGPEYPLTLVVTAITLAFLMMFAFSNKYAMWCGFAVAILVCFFVLGAAYFMYFYTEVLYLYLCATGILFFNLLLVHSTSVMIRGKNRYGITPRDCVFAAVCVYVDIWNFACYKRKSLRFV